MKIVQIIPQPQTDSKLEILVKNTERQLRGRHTTFDSEKEVAEGTDGLAFLVWALRSAPIEMRTDKN
jgi:hypothetical protein